jgi:hypothetical protein
VLPEFLTGINIGDVNFPRPGLDTLAMASRMATDVWVKAPALMMIPSLVNPTSWILSIITDSHLTESSSGRYAPNFCLRPLKYFIETLTSVNIFLSFYPAGLSLVH